MTQEFIALKRPKIVLWWGELGLWLSRLCALVHLHLGRFDKIFGLIITRNRRLKWVIDPIIFE
jgi:hypothetical protein